MWDTNTRNSHFGRMAHQRSLRHSRIIFVVKQKCRNLPASRHVVAAKAEWEWDSQHLASSLLRGEDARPQADRVLLPVRTVQFAMGVHLNCQGPFPDSLVDCLGQTLPRLWA